MAEWNPFAGEVQRLDRAIQLQVYRMPWPFASREYLVRCEDSTLKSGHLAKCSSIDAHPAAPLRSDRVRGRSETVWRFITERNGQTSIHLETFVDPRGGLPAWVVDKVGKSAAVTIVRGLMRHTQQRLMRAGAGSCHPTTSADGGSSSACGRCDGGGGSSSCGDGSGGGGALWAMWNRVATLTGLSVACGRCDGGGGSSSCGDGSGGGGALWAMWNRVATLTGLSVA